MQCDNRQLQSLSRKANTSISCIENHVLSLEQNITIDGEANASIWLNAAIALGGANRCIIHIRARNNATVATNAETEARERRTAGENIATLGIRVRRAGDLGPVSLCGRGWDQKERGSGVDDGVDAEGHEGARADGVAIARDFPEAVAGFDAGVRDAAGVLGGVDVAEVIGSGGAFLQADGEEGGGQGALHAVEEGLLRGWRDRVDGAEGEAEQAVVVGVRGEGGADGCRCLDGLGSGGYASDNDLVSVDIAPGTRAISVGNGPGISALLSRGAR
jgi:hypothetical protein